MSCEALVINKTTLQGQLNQANSEYMNCLGPQERGAVALQGAKAEIDRAVKEAEGLAFMGSFILNQLEKETGDDETLSELANMAVRDTETMQREIEDLKSQIRTEKRKFLDSDPSVSPAAGGLYFTKNSDNQMLIAFLSCFGSFLVIASVAYAMGYIPLINKPTGTETVKIIATFVVVSVVLMYMGFYMFT
jgi:hypothetical protein